MSDTQPEELFMDSAQVANEQINEGEARGALLPPHFMASSDEIMLNKEIESTTAIRLRTHERHLMLGHYATVWEILDESEEAK